MKRKIILSMGEQELEKLLRAGAELSKLGNELSKKFSKISNPFENLKISIPDIYKIKMPTISIGTGTNYCHCNYSTNENLEFTPTRIIRVEIDNNL